MIILKRVNIKFRYNLDFCLCVKMCVSFAKSSGPICKSRNGESGNGMRGTMGMRGIRVETRGIRVGTRGIKVGMRGIRVGMREIKVGMRGIGVGMLGVGNSKCDSV